MQHLLVWFSALGANVGMRCRYQDESKLVVLTLWCPQIGDADGDAYFWTFDDVDFNGDDNHDGCHVVRGVPGTKQCLHRLADHTALFARDPVRRHLPVSCVCVRCYVLCAVCYVLCVMCLSKVAQNAVFVLLTMCLRLCCVMWHHVLCAFGCASTVCNYEFALCSVCLLCGASLCA